MHESTPSMMNKQQLETPPASLRQGLFNGALSLVGAAAAKNKRQTNLSATAFLSVRSLPFGGLLPLKNLPSLEGN